MLHAQLINFYFYKCLIINSLNVYSMENVTIKCNQGSISISALDSDNETRLDVYDCVGCSSLYVDKDRAEKIILALKERFDI